MRFLILAASLGLGIPAVSAELPKFEAKEIDAHVGNVCYALAIADVDGDKKPDIVAATEDAVVWFANPGWEKHDIIRGATKRDNVCIQPHDIDGDGQVDFALGAGWNPSDTKAPSTLQWLGRDASGKWKIHPISYREPTLHRLRWGDVLGDGHSQLVVAPLQGFGSQGPTWTGGPGVRVQVFSIPKDATKPDWPLDVADDSLHTAHNLQIVDVDGDGREDILIAAREGVFALRHLSNKWFKYKLGTGYDGPGNAQGASEIKLGRLKGGVKFLAAIEPFHGQQVVVYSSEPSERLWNRRVIDEPVTWGHGVWCADVDGDGDDEILVGQRDPNKTPNAGKTGPGVWLYDPKRDGDSLSFAKSAIDDGGMAAEDVVVADLDGDGRPEVIAGGRATHNVKIYWNR